MSNSASFNAIFTVNVNSEQEFSEWMKNFQKTSDTQFNIHKTYVCDGRYVVFKKTYKCHHNVNRGVLGRHKHTSCNAKATVTIRHCPKRIRKDRTKVHPDGLCLIDLTWDHNHPLSAADVVRHYSALKRMSSSCNFSEMVTALVLLWSVSEWSWRTKWRTLKCSSSF